MISIYKKNDLVNIILQDKITYDDSITLKQTLINSQEKIQIAFIDISTIKDNLVFLLDSYKSKLNISSNNRNLWLYLKRLGIEISLHHHIKKYKDIHINIKALAIGGSAGSLRNMVKIIQNIPYCDINIFAVMHILPDQKNKLTQIFSLNTSFKVLQAKDGMSIEKSTIYVAPPDLHMVVQNKTIKTLNTPKVNYCRPSIDVTFDSLALEYKNSLCAILTCGYLDDGSRSLENIKKHDGTVLIQDPNSCEANEIPINAMLTKNYDFVFSIDDICEYLKSRLNLTLDLESRVTNMIKKIQNVYGYDFTDYDAGSLIRRVELLRQELGINHFNDLEDLILSDKEVFESLFEKLSINVSEFFRDTNSFKFVKEELFNQFKNQNTHIKIWCAASSKGQEAYSIAMILDELGLLERSVIYATDINEFILSQAKNGIYSKEEFRQCCNALEKLSIKNDPRDWFDIKENYVCINERIKRKVHFFSHNLVTDGEINEFQVVFCRNVLIYFNEKLQNRVLDLIYDSLVLRGILVLGESEHIVKKDKFKKVNSKFDVKAFVKISKGDIIEG